MSAPKDPVKYEEWRRHVSEGGKGRVVTEATRQKISEKNLGKYVSKATCQKISESRKGKHFSPFTQEHCKKISEATKGRKGGMEGKRHHPEHCKRMSETQKGRKFSEETRKKMSESAKTRPPVSKITSKKISENVSGEKNPMYGRCGAKHPFWKGGRTSLPYCFKFNPGRRKSVRVFFGYLCICCGKHVTENITKTGRWWDLSVHHVDHDKEQGCNGRPFNLVPMCVTCHGKETHYEQEYKDYINKTLKEGFKWGIWSREQYETDIMYPESG